MHFNSLFMSSLLLISAVLAHPGGKNLSQHVQQRSETYDTLYWIGAVLRNEPISVITGTFVVPHSLGYDGSDAGLIISVGIGEDFGPCNVVQAGIKILDTENGTSYTAFFQWCPEDMEYITTLAVSPEDEVRLEVSVFIDPTFATFSMENVGKGIFSKTLKRSYTPHTGMAEWIVQPVFTIPNNPTSELHLAKFSPVTFTNARALGPGDEQYSPRDAQPVEALAIGGDSSPKASIDGDTVTIQIVTH